MPTPAELLAQSLAKLQTANRIDGTSGSYRKDNPSEYAKVVAYLQGGARPTGVASDMGMGLMLEEDARRALAPVPPEPPPEPPVGEWKKVADEHQTFVLPGPAEVRYGKGTTWIARTLPAGSQICNSGTFGSDPAPGTPKECQALSGAVPTPPEPPPTGAKPLTNAITTGGTYSGSVSGDITVNTTQPVVIDTFVMNNGTIRMPGGADVTIRRGTITGPDAWTSPRWLYAGEWKRLIIENNTITNTTGMELNPNHQPNPTTQIRYNKHTNPKGNGISPVGNFVQMRVIWGGDKWASDGGKNPNPGIIEIAWNEIVSEYQRSNPEDVISIYKTARTRIHDNLINGQSKPSQFSGSSQNSITVDPADERDLLYDNLVERNFVIDAFSIGMFGGNNNLFKDNYIVNDGKIGDSGVAMPYGYSGLFIGTNGAGNKAIDNHVGYIGSQGRVDFQQDAGQWTGNVSLPNPITRQTELDHIAMWRKRVSDAGLTIGA